jgi:hypothetical protein
LGSGSGDELGDSRDASARCGCELGAGGGGCETGRGGPLGCTSACSSLSDCTTGNPGGCVMRRGGGGCDGPGGEEGRGAACAGSGAGGADGRSATCDCSGSAVASVVGTGTAGDTGTAGAAAFSAAETVTGRGESTTAEGAGDPSAGAGACDTGSGASTVAARGARSAAPCGARSTAAAGGAPSDVRGAALGVLPLREAGADRGDFDALLFGAALEARGARADFGEGSTESIAAMRSACVMPAMSGGATEAGRDAEAGFATVRGAVDGDAAAAGCDAADEAPSLAAFGGVDADAGDAADAAGRGAAVAASSARGASPWDGALAGVERGVPSGARRTM